MKFRWWHETILAILLGVLLFIGWRMDPTFLDLSNQLELSRGMLVTGLVALTMLLVILTGGIDLSVGSMIALSAVVFGMCFKMGIPVWICAPIAIGTGVVLGALNGWFVAKLKVHPLIVTLATMAAFRGVAAGLSRATPISKFPNDFLFIGQQGFFGVPNIVLFFALAVVILAIAIGKSAFGRSLFAIGHNEKAARFSGIAVDRIKMTVYTLSGLMCGIAAIFMVSYYDTAKADLAMGQELEVITAVVLGGASINGGKGNVLGLLLGILLLLETNIFIDYCLGKNELKFIVGFLLIASVLIHRALQRKKVQEDT